MCKSTEQLATVYWHLLCLADLPASYTAKWDFISVGLNTFMRNIYKFTSSEESQIRITLISRITHKQAWPSVTLYNLLNASHLQLNLSLEKLHWIV